MSDSKLAALRKRLTDPQKFWGNVLAGVVAGTILLLITLAATGVFGGDEKSAAPGSPAPGQTTARPVQNVRSEDDLRRYIEQQTVWASPPNVLGENLKEALTGTRSYTASPVMEVDDGIPPAHSVSELATQGASAGRYGGSPVVFAVGRVRSAVEIPVEGLSPIATKFSLAGPTGDVIYGTGGVSTVEVGEVVFVPVVVVAVGEARNGKATAYVLTQGESAPIRDYGLGRRTIPQLAREFAR